MEESAGNGGTVNTVGMPASEVRLILLTPTQRRGTPNATQSLAITVGEVVGPLVEGLILALFDAPPVFVIAAIIQARYGLVIAKVSDGVPGVIRVVEEDSIEAVEW